MVSEFGLWYHIPEERLDSPSLVAGLESAIRDKATERGWSGGDFDYRIQDEISAAIDDKCPDGHRTVWLILRGVTRG